MRFLREYANKHNLNLHVEVDGGLSPKTIKHAAAAGANMIVAGSAVFRSEAKGFGDAKTAMDSMRSVVDNLRTGGEFVSKVQ